MRESQTRADSGDLSQLHHPQGLRVRPRHIDIILHPDVRDVLDNDISTEMGRETMEEKLGPILPDLIQQ